MRVGEVKNRKTDVRVIAATNKNIETLVNTGDFRQDLYFRLKTVNIKIPPLRERVEDVNAFIERFSLEFTRSNDIRYRGFSPDAIRLMKQYDWPGNIRELKHFVERIIVMQKGERITKDVIQNELEDLMQISADNSALPVVVSKATDKAEIDLILRQLFMLKQDTELIQKILISGSLDHNMDKRLSEIDKIVNDRIQVPQKSMEIVEDNYKMIRDDAIGSILIKNLEEEAIRRTIKFYNSNRRKTAKSLGMSERTLYRKIEEYGLEPKIKK